jgi:hypothetical protein
MTDYQKLLTDYINENLTPRDERRLFRRLSKDDLLRSDMEQLQELKRKQGAVKGQPFPSSASTAVVFAKAGYSSGSNSFLASAVSVKLLTGVVSSLVTALLTVGYFMFFNSGNISEHENQISEPVADATVINKVVETPAPTIPESKTQNILNDSGDNSVSDKSKNETVASSRIIDNQEEMKTTADIAQSSIELRSVALNHNSLDIEDESEIYTFIKPNQEIPTYRPRVPKNKKSVLEYMPEGLSISVTSSMFNNTDDSPVTPSYIAPLHNFSATLLYKLTDKAELGFSARQETFYVDYLGTKDGLPFRFEQQPNFTTYDLIFRYNLPLAHRLNSFLQTGVGTNFYGLTNRWAVGLEYEISDSWKIYVQPEYDVLFFKHENQYFNSSKYGLTYGVSYEF